MRLLRQVLLAAAVCLPGIATHATQLAPIAYPEGFRSWAHVKSGILDTQSPGFARYNGVHHIYANVKAMEGLRSGKYADGATLVFDVLEIKPIDGGSAEGLRRLINVMARDAVKFAATGGWGYEEFVAADLKKPVLSEASKAACHGCHQSMKHREFVFSILRD